ncbi:endonuclease domain-containing protein [Streptomyces sp. H27-H1]|uniref:endonuclease domain-containing protein n=1 Tax=Streptomyces sp. H27-H1 TaxID=2996461 RepID=UPI00226DABC9|nr:endonuclease domain-containing protein [Streptomyces sp. H27-H1]MCY0926912.1 endonuclease domain-containing protein [Streptomyces sp. H27-H1]
MHHQTCQHNNYRLTCEDFDELWHNAGGSCQICRTPATDAARGKLYIDHAGEYGPFAVRGLLCSKCNTLMRHVDSGQRYDERASRYKANAWFIQVLHARHAQNVKRRRLARRSR